MTEKEIPERRRYRRFKVKKELSERRKHYRYRLKHSTYVVLNPGNTRLGQLVDISEKGVALHCFDIGVRTDRLFDSSELSLFTGEGSLYLNNLPVKIIPGFGKADMLPYDSAGARRLFVKFEEITFDQKSRLKYFIKNHTDGFSKDRRRNKIDKRLVKARR
jgi:hypothetical protein